MKLRKAALLVTALLPALVACRERAREGAPGKTGTYGQKEQPKTERGEAPPAPGARTEPGRAEPAGTLASARIQSFENGPAKIGTGSAMFMQQGTQTSLLVNVQGATPGRYAVQLADSRDCSELEKQLKKENKAASGETGTKERAGGTERTGVGEERAGMKVLGTLTVGSDGQGRLETPLTGPELANVRTQDLEDRTLVFLHQPAGTETSGGAGNTPEAGRAPSGAPAQGSQWVPVACGEINRGEEMRGS